MAGDLAGFDEWWSGTFEAHCVAQFGWTTNGMLVYDLLRQCWHASAESQRAEVEQLQAENRWLLWLLNDPEFLRRAVRDLED